jgi:hypothetical protein
MNEKNIETLLVKLVGELKSLNAEVRGLRADLRRRAGEPEPVEAEKKKPWGLPVVSVTKAFGKPVDVGASDVPSALTPSMRREAEAQKVEPSNPRGIETVKADDEPIRFTDEQIANFRGFRGARR